jgi:hypothetical protein
MNALFGVQINSWNAQGGFREKSKYLDGMLSSLVPNILLLQEQGTRGGTGYNENEVFTIGESNYCCMVCEEDPIAHVERCTTAIMVENGFVNHVVGRGTMSGAVERPLCYIDLASGVRVATIHAIANSSESVLEIKHYIDLLDKESPNVNWIFMGDFNSEPLDYALANQVLIPNIEQVVRYKGTESRPKFCYVIADSQPTQGPVGQRISYLDFAFTSINHNFAVDGIRNRMVYDTYGNYRSDHNLIQLSVRI